MNSRDRSIRDVRDLCAHIHDDDGVDPRYDKKKERGSDAARDRKTLQLCKQVRLIVSAALRGVCRDAVLQELEVVSVRPAPNASRLLVGVQWYGAGLMPGRAAVLSRLGRAKGLLRAEIAAGTSRKRVPELVFELGVNAAIGEEGVSDAEE
jgi:ribosome-binding factor A